MRRLLILGIVVAFTLAAASAANGQVSIVGTWTSSYGTMQMWEQEAPKPNGPVVMSGQWTRPQGGTGTFQGGVFDPNGRILVIKSYQQSWNNAAGSAKFKLSPDGDTLTGDWTETYTDADGNRKTTDGTDWILQRSR